MIDLTIRDLLELVASGTASPETKIDKTFDWAHARRLELAKWLLAISAALFVPVAVAYVRNDIVPGKSNVWVLAAVFASVLLATVGLSMLYRARAVHVAYLATQQLLGRLQRIAPFVQRYRDEFDRRGIK